MRKILYVVSIALVATATASCGVKKSENSAPKSNDSTLVAAKPDTAVKAETATTAQSESAGTVMDKPIHLTKADFLKKVVDFEKNPKAWNYLGDKPAIIDFWASWCGPCKTIAPTLDALASEYKGQIYIYKVNVDDERELASVFGIQSIPTLVFVPMNEQPQAEVGVLSKDVFKEKINNFLLKNK